MEFLTKSNDETIALGKKIGSLLKGGEIILLEGDLGGGKTQFTKGVAEGLGITETVISPTFTIERIYSASNLELHHFDFYRLMGNDPEIIEEVEELRHSGKNIVVIEWPQNLFTSMPKEFLLASFEYISENERSIKFDYKGKTYKNILEKL